VGIGVFCSNIKFMSKEPVMKIARMILTASIAGILVAAPVGFAQAVDAHHPAQGATTKKAQPKPKKNIGTKKIQGVMLQRPGRMTMAGMKGGMMANCPMMQRGQAGQGGMMKGKRMQGNMMQGGMMQGGMMQAGTMQCPMMSASNSSMSPLHSIRMQWHHNMMMWHHQMLHGQSSMHRGS